ncbi:toxin-antitoxin system YwqK family antitoxin [Polaribacter sp. L3A8]|uniref:toxin-antitoxin system YwqK family antitoxin n=1 Tax=Polaribacter sp. L3A8 TaxID=2686361 RepID=UPI00131D5588|nr:toxin-antitoxin system YwqK family antitoxin [Polaribacter sp. L3A8]
MKKLLIAILFVANFSFSQEKIPFIDYDEVLQKIYKEVSDDKIVDLINTLHKNDSSYNSLLVVKSFYLLKLNKYEEALEVVNEGLNNNSEYFKADFYANKGVALSSLERYDEALKNYDEGLKIYPKNYLFWFNKGLVLEVAGNLNAAVNAYKKVITLNPTYTKPHILIGNIYYKQNRLTQALMCFNLYLLLEPNADNSAKVLKSLNNIVKSKKTNKRNPNIVLDDEDDSFKNIDVLLTSKVALNKNYKTGNSIDIALVRQNHAMIEKLKNFEGNGGFWDHTYIPFYKWIATNNTFDDFIYTLTYAIENEDYQKIIKKKKKQIIAFLLALKIKWANNVSKNNILFNGKQQDVTYKYDNYLVNGIGNYKDGKTVGFWQFYNEFGGLTTEGNFDDLGARVGKWIWYSSFNKIEETTFYKEGMLDGKNLMFYENGKKYVDAIFKNDSLQGLYEYFNNKGALVERKYFKYGKIDGLSQSYFSVGEKLLELEMPYREGKIEGEVLEYYANGDLYSKSYYVDDKKNGIETTYHYNNNILSEINYVNDELSGRYKTFHSNGKPKEIGQTLNGYYTGAWRTYYSDGTLESKSFYKKGNLSDFYRYYDTDGKLYYDYIYRKGELIAFTFYNKDATILNEGKKRKGAFYYEGFSPEGNKITEGLYDVSGGKVGEWKFYTNNSVLKNKGNFKDDKIIGEYFTYFKNGKIDNSTTYKENVIDGYYVAYYDNEQMRTQGWYKEGSEHGEWRYYNLDGSLNAINFYHKGLLNGTQESYGVDGKLIATTFYKFGDLISENTFGKEEFFFEKVNYTSKENEYQISSKHYNGNINTTISYVNEVKHGNYEAFYFNGKAKIKGSYLNGAQNGTWVWYFENGNIERSVNYSMGNLQGKLINYYKEGKIKSTSNYDSNLEIGTSFKYYDNGVKKASIEYYEGQKHGENVFYDVLGKLQLICFYNHGAIIGYSYLDKNGTEIAMIPLAKESGKIEGFFDNGKVSKTSELKHGEFIHSCKSYAYDGKLIEEIKYVDGNYHGVRKSYFSNGNVKKEINYNHGEKHGKQIVFFENGNKKEELIFINNVEHGMSFFYDEAGKIKTKKEYFNGKVYTVENL